MKKLSLFLFVAGLSVSTHAVAAYTPTRIVGGDLSLLPSYEQYNTPYYDEQGAVISDVLTYVHDVCGWNAVRVRLFVNPTERISSHTGVVQDLPYVTALGKRIKDAGMQFMLDFHYSDCWCDPSYQDIPASWKTDTSDAALSDSLYQYTTRTLNTLNAAGATPDYVQIGNEISYGMLWRGNGDKVYPGQARDNYATGWNRLVTLLSSASKAVRAACPNAKIVVHTERSGNSTQSVNFYSYIDGVDYDVIGLSYYCFYHNDLPYLGNTLTALATAFPTKEVQIVETAYFYNWYPSYATYNFTSKWPASASGQKTFTEALISELSQHSNTTGLFWWFAEENGNGGSSYNANTLVIDTWLNRGLWDDSSHKALPTLYVLKDFLGEESALPSLRVTSEDKTYIDLYGHRQQGTWNELSSGIYVTPQGEKILK